jgi:hypothetical protein
MCVLSIRQGLSLRDAGNRLAHQVNQLQNEINNLKFPITGNQPVSELEKAKQELLERAEKFGIKLSFEE